MVFPGWLPLTPSKGDPPLSEVPGLGGPEPGPASGAAGGAAAGLGGADDPVPFCGMGSFPLKEGVLSLVFWVGCTRPKGEGLQVLSKKRLLGGRGGGFYLC